MTKDEKNYPQKICTICITYLKHAVTFRRQVINNDRCIRQQTFYPGNEPFNIKGLLQNDYNGGGGGGSANDTVWNDMNLAPESITFDSLKMEIEEAFGGECDDSDDDESDDAGTSNIFNYKEKSFTEDDITDFVHKSVVITIPDEMRERKCDACKQRFMLKESFDQHLKDCIELKLNKFITEGYQLLSMRKSRALSANEFNRRMIFALKKMVKSLTSCYKEVSDSPSTNIIDDKVTKKNNFLDTCDNLLKKPNNTDIETTQLSTLRLPNLLSSLEGKPNVSIQKNHLLDSSQHGYGFITSNENGGDNQMAFSSTPIPNHFKSIDNDNDNGNDESLPIQTLQLGKPQTKHKRRHPNDLNTVVAQCSQCNQSFSSLQQFEEHIRKNHNSRNQTSSNVRKIIQFLFGIFFFK